jgi:hypothetical protein
MLRVQTQEIDDALICRLEGRLTGEGAEQVRLLVTRCNSKLDLVVDLTELMFVDSVGEDVLWFVKRLGGEFIAETAYTLDICERLRLPLVQNHIRNSKTPEHVNGKERRPDNNPLRQ